MVKRSYETDRSVLRAIINEPSTGGTAISSYTYGVNDLGQRESVSQAGTAFPTADAVDWGYDALGQVVSANATSLSANDRYYAFDSIGNRLQSRVATPISTGGTATDYYSEAPPTPTTIGANSLNQYGGIKVGTGPITAPTHDLDGNLTYDGTKWHYDWDGENRMISAYTSTSITSPARIDYAYDYLGRCYRRQVKSWNGSAWVLATTLGYLYDGWNRVAATSPSNTWNEELVWGLDLSGTSQGAGGVGGLLVWSRVYGGGSWESYYPTYDGNGNVSEMLNASGMVSAHWEYDAFGNTTYKTAGSWPSVASEFTYRFSTKPMDLHTGLYYYGYRYYDPVTGRWPSRDPIGERGGVNLYGCVSNCPVSSIEILGLFPMLEGFTHGIPANIYESAYEQQKTPEQRERDYEERKEQSCELVSEFYKWYYGDVIPKIAIPATSSALASLETVTVAVTGTTEAGQVVHFMWKGCGSWRHAVGKNRPGGVLVTSKIVEPYLKRTWIRIPVPVRDVAKADLTDGRHPIRTCFGAVVEAIKNGWK